MEKDVRKTKSIKLTVCTKGEANGILQSFKLWSCACQGTPSAVAEEVNPGFTLSLHV